MKTCKEVHRLVSEGQDRSLSFPELIAIRIHLLLCSPCRQFKAQMQFLREALRRFPG